MTTNAEQATYWNEQAGPVWVAEQRRLDAMLGPIGEHLLDRAGLAAAQRVLDVGCGCGALTLAAARRVGRDGRVLGIDLSQPMLERASERARSADLAVAFRRGDAQTEEFDGETFDAIVSRFGVMFFGDPLAAFRNLNERLAPRGRLAFVCWQSPERNPWFTIPLAAAASILGPAQPPADPLAPGPYALADPERVRAIVDQAGFREVVVGDLRTRIQLGGGDLDDATEGALRVGPLSRRLKERELSEETIDELRRTVRDALERATAGGPVELDAAAWLVEASADA